MAIKKSQLYSTLWESCNALRGSMDASQYKDYVLMILFVKYLSDKAKQKENMYIVIPDGCYFDDFVALKQSTTIGEEINKKLEAIKEANIKILSSLTLPNYNDTDKFGKGKEMIDTLSDLIGVFENDDLDFSKNRAADDDLLGDAYEYLMKNFAQESGKSKGQFYTPAEVSRVMAKVLRLDESSKASDTIYDPTCGSSSLLLRANAETQRGMASLYGQEKDSATASLAKLNMLLHGVVTADIEVGDTLKSPKHTSMGQLKTFDFCVANPPFSTKNWLSDGNENDAYRRWTADKLPPKKNGDYAFLLHLINSMKPETGRGACILPHGVLFRGNAEQVIRTDLVKSGVIQGIIGLPANIFFGTGIPAAIIILDNQRTKDGIFFVDASAGFIKDGNKNRLREQDIQKIVDTYRGRIEIPHYSRFVPMSEIEKNEYNLNIPRYIEPENNEETHDMDGHLRGGISSAEIDRLHQWTAFPGLKEKLLSAVRPGYFKLATDPDNVFSIIMQDEAVQKVKAEITDILNKWEEFAGGKLTGISAQTNAKLLVNALAMNMRDSYANNNIINLYDAYGIYMNYAIETMQDDLFVICADGWKAGSEVKEEKDKKGKVKSWEGLLLPKALIKQEFFPSELEAVQGFSQKLEQQESELEQFIQECADMGEDNDPLSEIRNDDKMLSDADCKKVLKQSDDPDEKAAITKYLNLRSLVSETNKSLKTSEGLLEVLTLEKYSSLSEEQMQNLMINKKWLPAVRAGINNLWENIIQSFANSIIVLHERYKDTLPTLEHAVAESQAEVHNILKELGFDWGDK